MAVTRFGRPSRLSDHSGKGSGHGKGSDLLSFAKGMRPYLPNERPVSSVYSVPDMEAIDRAPKPFDVTFEGEKQKTSTQHDMDRREAFRDVTKDGKVLCPDGVFRMAGSNSDFRVGQRRASYSTKSNYDQATTPAAHLVHGSSSRFQHVRKSAQQKIPMQVITRHGKILSADNVSYVGDSKDESNARSGAHLAQEVGRCRKDQGTQTTFPEGSDQEQIPLENITLQNLFDEPIVVSATRYVVPNSPTRARGRRPSLVRRLSDSVRGAFRRRPSLDKRDISRPREFQGHDPRHDVNHDLYPEIKAIPLAEAQRRAANMQLGNTAGCHPWGQHQVSGTEQLAGSSGNFRRELPLRIFHEGRTGPGDVACSRRTGVNPTWNLPVRREPAYPPSREALCGKPNVRVVGQPGRDTLFGDFIDADAASCNGLEPRTDHVYADKCLPPLPLDDHYSRPELAPESLHVPKMETVGFSIVRKESLRKRVDTSAKSWMPPDHGGDVEKTSSHSTIMPATLAEVASSRHSRVSGPTIHNILDPVEDIIDAYAHSEYNADEENAEIEIFLDTFDRGSHCSWIESRRPKSPAMGSDYSHFGRHLYNHWRSRDEAGRMVGNMRRSRGSEVDGGMYMYI